MGRLDGKVALVTGGGSGIGRATCILFAKEGAKVAIADYSTEGGEETLRMIEAVGGETIFIKADVASEPDVKDMIKATIDTYGKLDIVFNNAGVLGKWLPIVEYDEAEFDKIININIKGVWLGMRYAIPEMIKAGGGIIINTISHAAYQPQIGSSIYCASKAAVFQLTRVAALEYIKRNIRINWFAPGFISTAMAEEACGTDSENVKRIISETPLGRLGKPEEAAQAVLFLASDDSSYITGSGVTCDGGIPLTGEPVLQKVWW